MHHTFENVHLGLCYMWVGDKWSKNPTSGGLPTTRSLIILLIQCCCYDGWCHFAILSLPHAQVGCSHFDTAPKAWFSHFGRAGLFTPFSSISALSLLKVKRGPLSAACRRRSASLRYAKLSIALIQVNNDLMACLQRDIASSKLVGGYSCGSLSTLVF